MSNLNDGFSWFNLSAVTLTNAAQNGAAVARKPGMFNLAVMGTMTDADGDNPTVSLQLQGSMDGTNWIVLAVNGANNQFTGAGSVVVLGVDGGDSVDCQRFKYIRPALQVLETAGGVTWSVAVKVSGIGRDGAVVDYSKQTIRAASNPYVAATNNGAAQTRMSGLKHLTCQVTTTAFVAGGATVTANFQISPDSGTTWFTIATQAISGTGSFVFEHDNSNLIDLGGCNKYRVQVVDTGGNTTTAYTYTEYFGGDASDWLTTSVNAAQQVPEVLNEALLRISLAQSAEGTPGANQKNVTVTVTKLDGTLLNKSVTLRMTVCDTALAGAADLAANAVWNSVSTGTARSATGANQIIVTTAATGIAVLVLQDTAGETVYIQPLNSLSMTDSGQAALVLSAPQLTSIFAP